MVEHGLLECNPSREDPVCMVKIVECTVSVGMILLVAYCMIRRMWIDCRISFYLFVSTFMFLTLSFLIAFYIDSDLLYLSYLAAYCYCVYFSIIVLKVGIKLIDILRNRINYPIYRRITIISFVLYQVFLFSILIYASVQEGEPCVATPFLIENILSLTAAILFVILGIKHNRVQQRKIDQSLAEGLQNNPLPRFRCWILTNFIGQVLVMTWSIIYKANECEFSQDRVANEIMFAIFSFLSFHLGIGSTIYFFYLVKTDQADKRDRNVTLGINQQRQIEMVYVEEIRTKMFTTIFMIIRRRTFYLDFNQVMNQQLIQHNPYKVMPLGALEGNCIGKAVVSYIMGGAMGLVMAMFMNAVEMREIEIGKVRRSTPIVLRKDWRKMKGTSKGFATFGGIFVFFECMIEHVRGKEDSLNSFLSGFATSVVLGGNCTSVRKQLFYSGMGGGLVCVAFYKVFKWMGH